MRRLAVKLRGRVTDSGAKEVRTIAEKASIQSKLMRRGNPVTAQNVLGVQSNGKVKVKLLADIITVLLSDSVSLSDVVGTRIRFTTRARATGLRTTCEACSGAMDLRRGYNM